MAASAVSQTLLDHSDSNSRTWCWVDTTVNVHWLFGMRWLPALGKRGQRALHRDLRQQGVGWAVNHGDRVHLVGVASLGQDQAQLRQAASAAVAYALQHPQGVHALCLKVSGVGVWLVACSNGCVLSDTDRWFDCFDQAQAFFYTLGQRYEHLQLEVLEWQPEQEGDSGKRPDFLNASFTNQCRFCKLPSAQVSWPLLAVGLVTIAAGIWFGRSYWVAPDTDHVAVAKNEEISRASVIRVHEVAAIEGLISAWHSLPVDPQGWLLQGVLCQIGGDIGRCKATYQRREPDADNEGLIQHKPRSWTFEASSLDTAVLQRTIRVPMRTLGAHMRVSRVFGLTALQRLSSRVAMVTVGSPVRVVSDTGHMGPQVFTDSGQADPTFSGPFSRWPVSVRMALRDAERLSELNLPLRWRQAELAIVQNAQIDALQGYLMVNLQGDWFEAH